MSVAWVLIPAFHWKFPEELKGTWFHHQGKGILVCNPTFGPEETQEFVCVACPRKAGSFTIFEQNVGVIIILLEFGWLNQQISASSVEKTEKCS
jgi:hypothetical protein